jgi:hypothetical protein
MLKNTIMMDMGFLFSAPKNQTIRENRFNKDREGPEIDPLGRRTLGRRAIDQLFCKTDSLLRL